MSVLRRRIRNKGGFDVPSRLRVGGGIRKSYFEVYCSYTISDRLKNITNVNLS